MAIVTSGSFAPSPGGIACTDLKADVASYVMAQNNDRMLAKAQDFIASAVAKLNTRNWSWTLTYQDFVPVVGTTAYQIGPTFKSPRALLLLDTNNVRQGALSYLDPRSFEYYLQTTAATSSDPFNYTVHSPHTLGQVDLDVVPTAVWVAKYPTMRFWYNQRVIPCSAGTTFLDVPDEVGDFVVWHAKSIMAGTYDPQKAQFAAKMAADAWTNCIRSDFREQANDWSAFG